MVGDSGEQTIREAAHAWRSTLDDDPSDAERSEFAAWLREDPRHRDAYERAMAVWSLLAEVDRPLPRKPRFAFPRPLWIGSAAALAILLILLIALPGQDEAARPSEVTVVSTDPGEIRAVGLADGTTVTLGGASEIQFVFDGLLRRAQLLRGDAFFDVAHDATRPFVVLADPVEAEVRGTSFAVERRGRQASVLVASGRVLVSADTAGSNERDGPNQAALLEAGQSVRATRSEGLGSPQRIDANDVAAWRSGRLVFVGVPLREVVKALDRYDTRSISLGDTSKAQQPLTATLKLDDVDGSVVLLTETFGLSIDASESGSLILFERD